MLEASIAPQPRPGATIDVFVVDGLLRGEAVTVRWQDGHVEAPPGLLPSIAVDETGAVAAADALHAVLEHVALRRLDVRLRAPAPRSEA